MMAAEKQPVVKMQLCEVSQPTARAPRRSSTFIGVFGLLNTVLKDYSIRQV